MNIVKLSSIIVILISSIVFSQSQKDSVKTYKLNEITVKSGFLLEPKTVIEIGNKILENSDASAVSELSKFIPSVKLQTNSRGESLFYLRGSGERQLSLFFDGVPLNIPWDNRIDLSLVPTDAIEGISITKGIPSIVYGANALAGVINISSKDYSPNDKNKKFSLLAGENNFKRFSGNWINKLDKLTYLISASYETTDGFDLPNNLSLPNSNPGKLRLNSDNQNFSFFTKFTYEPNEYSDINISASYIDAEKGVPAETNVSKPRFWRYPNWKKYSINLNGSNRFGMRKSSILAYSFSITNFNMDINQYEDISYKAIDDIEKDKDFVFYGRLIYTKLYGNHSMLKFSASGFSTKHRESFFQNNYTEFSYAQNVFSIGGEYEFIKSKYSFTAGISLDGSGYPGTGDKPEKDNDFDYGINTAFVYSISPVWSLQFTAGRKTRFPTLRESFSGALGRFIPNPNLKPESAITLEFSVDYIHDFGSLDMNFFFTKLDDGIERKSLPEKQFMRINRDEIRTLGVELSAPIELNDNLRIQTNFTYLNSFAKSANGTFTDTLEYKPAIVAGLNIDYRIFDNLSAVIELNYVGKEFGFQEGNEFFKKLPDYAIFNSRISYLFNINENTGLEAYIRANNIFDSIYYTQWSLPEAGRQFFSGITLKF